MAPTIPETIRVLLSTGEVRRMALEEYVRGVVAAAMPEQTPLEALKAQAIAARTFGAITHRHIERGADVCVHRHCQDWTDPPSTAAARAVEVTRGLVAVYAGELIEAFYFSHCDGRTRDPSGLIPSRPLYLRAVACSCGFATLKGHGIGMCQRGAVVMARFGEPFEVILKHYYAGITLEHGVPTDEQQALSSKRPARLAEAVVSEREFSTATIRALSRQDQARDPGLGRGVVPAIPDIVPEPSLVVTHEELAAKEKQETASDNRDVVQQIAPEEAGAQAAIPDLPSTPPATSEESESSVEPPTAIPVEAFFAAHPLPETPPEPIPFASTESLPAQSPTATSPPGLIGLELSKLRPEHRLPQVLVDRLPGPCVIAGNLPPPGTIITIRDVDGHSVVTVTGTAAHFGTGGFEAPVDDSGRFTLTFEDRELLLELHDETVFIGYAD